MFQPSTSHASPVSGSVFDCTSSFASVGAPLGELLQRCISRLIERHKAR